MATWVLGLACILLGVAMVALLIRVSILSWTLDQVQFTMTLRFERLNEDVTSGFSTLRLDLGLPAPTMYCGLCLQWAGGDPRKHKDYCRFSYASWVRDFRLHHPGEPLPEGADDPDEQQQQGHRPVPGDPA
jgi:hypothetical protein